MQSRKAVPTEACAAQESSGRLARRNLNFENGRDRKLARSGELGCPQMRSVFSDRDGDRARWANLLSLMVPVTYCDQRNRVLQGL